MVDAAAPDLVRTDQQIEAFLGRQPPKTDDGATTAFRRRRGREPAYAFDVDAVRDEVRSLARTAVFQTRCEERPARRRTPHLRADVPSASADGERTEPTAAMPASGAWAMTAYGRRVPRDAA